MLSHATPTWSVAGRSDVRPGLSADAAGPRTPHWRRAGVSRRVWSPLRREGRVEAKPRGILPMSRWGRWAREHPGPR